MKLIRKFKTPINDTNIRKRVTEFLIYMGYQQHSDGKELVFKRGSITGTFFSMNPRKWNTNVKIRLYPDGNGTVVESLFDINTSGQVVTAKEKEYWNSELDNFQAVLCSDEPIPLTSVHISKSVVNENIIALLIILFTAFITGYIGVRLFGFWNGWLFSGFFSIITAIIIAGVLKYGKAK
jgi:hypothetical protein